ncbi:Hypothetical predicted protein [Cloeon dipterum]|uniref:Peptidase C14 caspase domain-containing protein n=1 Tax=Cloeon dipterum TaxID=197152 RepID=A0A8S1BWT9_9INSE|nr:Hypothetical predicted protein [Cloeon dipterum]
MNSSGENPDWTFQKGNFKDETVDHANFGILRRTMDGATDNVFVLVVHNNKTRKNCKDCAADVQNLRKTLEEKRNYKFRVLSSPKKEDLFSLLSDQEKLLQCFNSEDHVPSVFVIFFLNHGCDDKGNNFILEDIFASLSNLKSFSNCLKVCVLNSFQNELNSLPSESIEDGQISKSPFELDSDTKSMKNFIAFCTTSVVLTGSTIVNAICEILDNLDISMELLQFLTLIQGKIRCEETNAVTPKIRVFSKTEKFIIRPLPRKDEAVSCLLANKPEKSLEHLHVNSNLHKREMSAGAAIRSRWACIIYRKMSKQVRRLNKMILEKLNFNTMMDEWRNDILETYSGPEVDLVMACLFCSVDKQNENQEICLKMDHQEHSIPIANTIHQLDGGLQTKVIGKPKICILINQNVESSGTALVKEMAIRVTNHSGWLVLVIDECHTEQLIHLLQGDTLQRGKSLHELIAPLLVKGVSNTENVPMKSYHVPNFRYEAARLFSLLQKKNWSYVTPLDLAKNGFYYSGDDDNCRCAFCNLEVRGWEAGDTAHGEHTRWNPNCLFLKNIHNIDNVIIGQEEAAASKPGHLKGISDPFLTTESLSECLGSHLLQKETSSTNTTVRNLNLMLWSTSKHPNFASLLKRTETFKNYWPLSMAQTGHELARAGFYYTGSGDMVICFHCGIGLKDWDREDDPFKQHVKWSSACQFLLMIISASATTYNQTQHAPGRLQIAALMDELLSRTPRDNRSRSVITTSRPQCNSKAPNT